MMSEWISTSEQRPPNGTAVLVRSADGNCTVRESFMVNNGIGWAWQMTASNVDPRTCFPYWMRLPPDPHPKTTVSRELLYDASEWIERAVECCQSNSVINVSSVRPGVAFNDLLPRLRAALESE